MLGVETGGPRPERPAAPGDRTAPDPHELAEEVRRTVIPELAHHAGYDDAPLRALNFD